MRYSAADCSSTEARVQARVTGCRRSGHPRLWEAHMAPPSSRAQPGTNRLLELLPQDEHSRLSDALEGVSLRSKAVIARAGESYSRVLFPSAGVVSVLVPMGEEPPVEAAVIGFEGMVGLP